MAILSILDGAGAPQQLGVVSLSGVLYPIHALMDGVGNLLASTNVAGQNALNVNIVSASAGGLAVLDQSAFSAGSGTFTPSGGVFNDGLTAITSGQQAVLRMTPNRAQHINFRRQDGTEIGTTTNPIQVSLGNTAANGSNLNVQLQAGANSIGSVVGQGATVTVIPGVTAGGYTAGLVVGGKMTFAALLPASFNAVLTSIALTFKGSVQNTEFDVAIFSASPAGTFNDHVAPVIAAGDSALLLGIYPLTTGFSTLGTHTIYNLDGIAKQINGSATSLVAVVTSRASALANNLASVSDMALTLSTTW